MEDVSDLATAFYGLITGEGGLWDEFDPDGGLFPELYQWLTNQDEDDFVGIAKEINIDCFVQESGGVWHSLIDKDGDSDGSYVWLDHTDDLDRVMCDPEEFDPVSVSINGPTQIPPSAAEECGYWATTTGGAGLETFEWEWDGNLVSEDDVWAPAGGLSEGEHWLTVSVMDEYSGTADSDGISVDVDSSYSCE
jgi:hypothetical protein